MPTVKLKAVKLARVFLLPNKLNYNPSGVRSFCALRETVRILVQGAAEKGLEKHDPVLFMVCRRWLTI